MTEKPVVSVFCLTYNHERYVRDALEGFLSQKTNFKFEVLINDDASTDRTAEILREYEALHPDLLKVTYHTENQRSKKINNTRTHLLPQAQGKYFAWCEGDDHWTDPYKLQKQFDFMESHPEYTMCMHRAIMYDWSKNKYSIIPKQTESRDYSVDEILDIDYTFAWASTIVRREIYENLPDFLQGRAYTDVPMRIFAAISGKVHCMQEVMSTYNFRIPGSMMTNVRSKDKSYSIAYNQSAVDMLNAINEHYDGKYEDAVNKRLYFYEYHLNKHLGNLDKLQDKKYEHYRVVDQKRKDKVDLRKRMIPTRRTLMPDYTAFCEEIRDLWEWCHPVDYVEKQWQLQSALTDYLSAKNVTLLANAYSALEVTLSAMNLPKGGEVITTSFAPAGVAHAIAQNGLTPVFCDIEEKTLTIDVDKMEKLISERTCALLPVHMCGCICDVERIDRIAKKHRLKVVYDATQAFGAFRGDTSITAYGDAVIIGVENAGAVLCDSCALKTKVAMISDQRGVGISELSAAVWLGKLRRETEEREIRRQFVRQYRARLREVPGLFVPEEREGVCSGCGYFPVVCDAEALCASRDEFSRKLVTRYISAIPVSVMHNTFSYGAWQNDAVSHTPIASRVSRNIMLLPLHADLTEEEVDRVCDTVCELRKEFSEKD